MLKIDCKLIGLMIFMVSSGPLFADIGRTSDSEISIALTGDTVITRKISMHKDKPFAQMINVVRDADAAITNLEHVFFHNQTYPMNHASETGYLRSDPAMANELAWAGFDLIARANNHSGDYGVVGLRETSQHLETAGLIHAGVGENLPRAREARYFDTPNGRVALISVSSTFADSSRASASIIGIPARPGLSPLRYKSIYTVPKEQLESLRTLRDQLDPPHSQVTVAMEKLTLNDDELLFINSNYIDGSHTFNSKFVVGEVIETLTEPNKSDIEALQLEVKAASFQADYTVVTFHGHESKKAHEPSVPADFLVAFSRAMIDAGADVVYGHGPHVLRGIEIYKEKPILYSLGDFIMHGSDFKFSNMDPIKGQKGVEKFYQKEAVLESVIAVPRWKGKQLIELKLHPISLGYGKPTTVWGTPVLADKKTGKKIIQGLAELSRPFGTDIRFDGKVGYVKLSQ